MPAFPTTWTRHPVMADLAADLRAAGVQVDASSRARAEYSSDASLYRVLPQAVAFPRTAEEVEAAYSVCRSLGVPLTPRGAGTSIAGNAVGPGLVLDFSRHLNKVVSVDPEAATAVVEPGEDTDAGFGRAGAAMRHMREARRAMIVPAPR